MSFKEHVVGISTYQNYARLDSISVGAEEPIEVIASCLQFGKKAVGWADWRDLSWDEMATTF